MRAEPIQNKFRIKHYMKNLLREEINQIQYLFGYKRGFVISEQSDPNVDKKIEHLTNIKEKETDGGVKATYDKLIDYYTKIKNGESPESPDKRYTDFIDSKFTVQTADTSTPTLPKVKSEPNMPILGNLTGTDLTSAYNVLIGHFSNSKDFDGMAAFSTLLNNREKNTNMIELQKYLNSNTSVNLEQVYASISDKSGYENKGKGITKK